MWPFKKKEKLTFIPAQDIEQVYFNGYSKGLMKSKEAFTELGAHEERERILQWIANNDIGRCCFESHDLVAFIKGENA